LALPNTPALAGAHPGLIPNLDPKNLALDKLIDTSGDLAVHVLTALLILVATIWAARWSQALVRSALGRVRPRRGAADPTLQVFAGSLARNAILILGGVAILERLGVQTTSIITVLGAASLAVGLALQGTLANVAAGVMIFLLRPYRVGDIIETGGHSGRVTSLDLFVTELTTLDNLKIMAPNSKVFGDFIVDHSIYERRRADVVFRVPLTVDAISLMQRLSERVEADPRVLKKPAPPVMEITGMSEVFVEIASRPWAATDDYNGVKADIYRWAKMLSVDPAAALPTP
jgi:small conductance mechanosensitive channel